MSRLFPIDPWQLCENRLNAASLDRRRAYFVLNNDRLRMDGHFAEPYGSEGSTASPRSGIDWCRLRIRIDGELVDLSLCEINRYARKLDLRHAEVERSFDIRLVSGKRIKVSSKRFCSAAESGLGALRYTIEALNFAATISIDVELQVHPEVFAAGWAYRWKHADQRAGVLQLAGPRDSDWGDLATLGIQFEVHRNGELIDHPVQISPIAKMVRLSLDLDVVDGDRVRIDKWMCALLGHYDQRDRLMAACRDQLTAASRQGYTILREAHREVWAQRWEACDLEVDGAPEVQQQLRFQCFQLLQAYGSGDRALPFYAPRQSALELSAQSAPWEWEVYAFPFYLHLRPRLAKALLDYRYAHLPRALHCATALGYDRGATLFPTRARVSQAARSAAPIRADLLSANATLAYSIYCYEQQTGDREFMIDRGLELLIGLARFWTQRVHFSPGKQQYLLHGVTGPNEYSQHRNKPWYTSYLARWTLEYAVETVRWVKTAAAERYAALEERCKFYEYTETKQWTAIATNFYLPTPNGEGIIPAHADYFDLPEPATEVATDGEASTPVREPVHRRQLVREVQQPEVLLGLYQFAAHFEESILRANFQHYEKLQRYETPTAPGIPTILAARLGERKRAQELFDRLLADESDWGLSVDGSALGAAWMAVVFGFAGLRSRVDHLVLAPYLPEQWTGYRFSFYFQNRRLRLEVDRSRSVLYNESDRSVRVAVGGNLKEILGGAQILC